MNDRKYEKPLLQQKRIDHVRKFTGAGVMLLLAILCGILDAVALSSLQSTDGYFQLAMSGRLATLLTLGVVLFAVGAVFSFLNAANLAGSHHAAGRREDKTQLLVVKGPDVPNDRSKAA